MAYTRHQQQPDLRLTGSRTRYARTHTDICKHTHSLSHAEAQPASYAAFLAAQPACLPVAPGCRLAAAPQIPHVRLDRRLPAAPAATDAADVSHYGRHDPLQFWFRDDGAIMGE